MSGQPHASALPCVQFDEDINARHLEKACRDEGKVFPLRLPAELKGKKDPEVLRHLLPRGNVVLTIDKGLVSDHADCVSDTHPGVVVVALDDDDVRTIGTHVAQAILATFKLAFDAWHSVSWKNSVVTITPKYVTVHHVSSGTLVQDEFLQRSDHGWQAALAALLLKNASKSPLALPPPQGAS